MLPRLTSLTLATLLALAGPAAAHDAGEPAPRPDLPAEQVEPVSMTPVDTVPVGRATSLELVTLAGRDYVMTGTAGDGLHVVDVHDPTSPLTRAVYDCSASPGDVEVFHQRGRVLASYTTDAPLGADLARQCVAEANALGADLDGSERGTFLLDLTDPSRPTTVAFLETEHGASDQAVHPSGDHLYGTAPGQSGAVTVHDISDPRQPRRMPDLVVPGRAAHVTFDRLGLRAYVAAGPSVLVVDTSDPQAPHVATTLTDPRIGSAHQADIVSFVRGSFAREVQTLLVVAGAPDGGEACLGGLHFYELDGDAVDPSSYVGRWAPSDTGSGHPCAPHEFRVYEDQFALTVAWHGVGVLLLGIDNLAGSQPGGALPVSDAIRELGRYSFPGGDAQVFAFARAEGYAVAPFFAFAADASRGLDAFLWADPEQQYGVGPLRPEDLAAKGCEGVPETVRLHDRAGARPVHRPSIDCVSARAISEGIADLEPRTRLFSPTDQVTREQMATFLVRTLRAAGVDSELPDPEPDAFTDTEGSGHREAIAVLAAADVVYGYDDGTYRPLAPVSRAQMASYLVRAAQFALGRPLAESGGRRFTDVPDGSPHDVAIAVGDDNGLFAGTSATTFSPGELILRDQMATFLVRLLTALGR